MPIDGLVTATGTCQRLQLVSQHVAHSQRVHLDQLWEHLAELARQVLSVLLHLAGEMFPCQQRVEPCIDSGVDIGGQVLCQVVNAIGQQVFVQSVKDIADGLAR